jgi:hypothetical protein
MKYINLILKGGNNSMTFAEAMKIMDIPSGCIVLTDELGYWNLNINFKNNDGQSDQTQFDVYPYQFDHVQRRCEELYELWKDFCKENGFKQNSITSISLITPYLT